MGAVIYARYSSTMQRDASIEDQVRACRVVGRAGGRHADGDVHGPCGERPDPHAAGLPEAAGGRAGRRVRRGGGRGAGPPVARPGGRGGAVQAAALSPGCSW